MNLKGAYNNLTQYTVGDVVVFTDGVVYHLQKPAKAGVSPAETRNWARLDQRLGEAVKLIMDAITMATTAAASDVTKKIANNLTTTGSGKILDARQGQALKTLIDGRVSEKTLTLASSTAESTKVFEITVDDSGELTATEKI